MSNKETLSLSAGFRNNKVKAPPDGSTPLRGGSFAAIHPGPHPASGWVAACLEPAASLRPNVFPLAIWASVPPTPRPAQLPFNGLNLAEGWRTGTSLANPVQIAICLKNSEAVTVRVRTCWESMLNGSFLISCPASLRSLARTCSGWLCGSSLQGKACQSGVDGNSLSVLQLTCVEQKQNKECAGRQNTVLFLSMLRQALFFLQKPSKPD